jgi:hypothetical protein
VPLFYTGNPAQAAEGDLAAQIAAAKELVAKSAASPCPGTAPRFRKEVDSQPDGYDGFCDFMAPTFRAAGSPGSRRPVNISGGDG